MNHSCPQTQKKPTVKTEKRFIAILTSLYELIECYELHKHPIFDFHLIGLILSYVDSPFLLTEMVLILQSKKWKLSFAAIPSSSNFELYSCQSFFTSDLFPHHHQKIAMELQYGLTQDLCGVEFCYDHSIWLTMTRASSLILEQLIHDLIKQNLNFHRTLHGPHMVQYGLDESYRSHDNSLVLHCKYDKNDQINHPIKYLDQTKFILCIRAMHLETMNKITVDLQVSWTSAK